MRLHFGVLWIDNQPEDIETSIEEVTRVIQGHGFTPVIDQHRDGSKVRDLGIRQEKYAPYDLVLVDYDLGGKADQGDIVAKKVRKFFGFTDIIFYSAHDSPSLRKILFEAGVEGVFCASRQELPEKVEEQIEGVVKRLSRLDGMRGVAMATIARCDRLLSEIISAAYANCDETSALAAETKLDRLVNDTGTSIMAEYEGLSGFPEKIESRAVTSYHRFRLALSLTKKVEEASVERAVLQRYDREVLSDRNLLGHGPDQEGGDGYEVVRKDGTAVNKEEFPKLRQLLAEHLGAIESMHRILVPGPKAG